MAYLGHDNSWLARGDIYQISCEVAHNPKTILDMGSRHGEGYGVLGRQFPWATYIFIEPAPQCKPKIRKVIADAQAADEDARFYFMEGVLGEKRGTMDLMVFPGDDDQSSNFYTDRGGMYGQASKVEVQVFPYDELPYDTIDFAKINIEGAEYDLIESDFFNRIQSFVMEVHNRHVPGKTYIDAIEALKDRYDLTTYGTVGYKYCYIIGHRL